MVKCRLVLLACICWHHHWPQVSVVDAFTTTTTTTTTTRGFIIPTPRRKGCIIRNSKSDDNDEENDDGDTSSSAGSIIPGAVVSDQVGDDDFGGFVLDEFDDDKDHEQYDDEDEEETEDVVKNNGDVALPTTNSTTSTLPLVDLSDLKATISSNVSYFYLQNEIGLSEETMTKITFEAGSVLGMTAANIRHKVSVLKDCLNLNDDDMRTIIEKQPSILHLSADDNIRPKIQLLKEELDCWNANNTTDEDDDLRRLVVATPAVLCYSPKTLKTKLNFFTRLMGYTPAETRALLLSEPKLLRCSVRDGLIPRMRFLVRDMEISPDALRKIVQKHPSILLYSLDDNLIPKLIFVSFTRVSGILQ